MPLTTVRFRISGLANELNKVPVFSDGAAHLIQDLQLGLDCVKNVCRDSLDITVDKLDQVSRDFFQRFESSMALSIERLQLGVLPRLQQISNSIPFANKQPQLTSVFPKCIVLPTQGAADICVELNGNFPEVGNLHPSLTFNGHKATVLQTGT